MSKNLIIILSILGICSKLYAATEHYDNTRVFVQTDKIESLKKLSSVTKVKHLFKNHYLVKTNNHYDLQLKLKNKNIKFQKNKHAQAKNLPSVEFQLLPEIKTQSKFHFFNDPEVSKSWFFNDLFDGGISVNRYYLSPLEMIKYPVVVSIIDTGIDYNHLDLKKNIWVNQKEIADNNIDDDQNGYIDDTKGINLIEKDEEGNATTDPYPSHPHGTHVAGIIAAVQNNYIGIAGVASNAKVMNIRAVPDQEDETDADIVEAFLYSAKNGAKIINCSFGKERNDGDDIVYQTLKYIAEEFGVLVFASAGNDFWLDLDIDYKHPTSYDLDNIIVVSSFDETGDFSPFSNIGKNTVDIASPGNRIYSTVPENDYAYMSGTSMAAPIAAAVAAELWGIFPELSYKQIKKIIIESTVKVSHFEDIISSSGRIDMKRALQYTLENYSSL